MVKAFNLLARLQISLETAELISIIWRTQACAGKVRSKKKLLRSHPFLSFRVAKLCEEENFLEQENFNFYSFLSTCCKRNRCTEKQFAFPCVVLFVCTFEWFEFVLSSRFHVEERIPNVKFKFFVFAPRYRQSSSAYERFWFSVQDNFSNTKILPIVGAYVTNSVFFSREH